MAQLKVQNVAIPDTSSAARLLSQAYGNIGDSLGGITDLADQARKNQLSQNDSDLVKKIASTRNEKEFNTLVDSLNLRHNSDGLRQAVLNGRSAVLGYEGRRADNALTGARTGLVGAQTNAVYGQEKRAQGDWNWNDNKRREAGRLAGEVYAQRANAYSGGAFSSAIDRTESGGGEDQYDTLYGHQNRKNGVQVSQMTIGEALDFASPSGEYGQSVNQEIGRVATPMGKFQIVGSTLESLQKELDLPDDLPFTPKVQEELGLYLAQKRVFGSKSQQAKSDGLRAEWEGFKNKSDEQLNAVIADIESKSPVTRDTILAAAQGRKQGRQPNAENGYDVGTGFSGSNPDIFKGSQYQDFSTVLDIADKNFDAYTKGDQFRRGQRANEFAFNQSLDKQLKADQETAHQTEIQQFALDTLRSSPTPEDARFTIANNPDLSPDDVRLGMAAIDDLGKAVTTVPNDPARASSSPITPGLQMGVAEKIAKMDFSSRSDDIRRINRRVQEAGYDTDDPAVRLINNFPELGLDRAQTVQMINQIRGDAAKRGVDLSPGQTAALMEESLFRAGGFFSAPGRNWFDGVRRGKLDVDPNQAVDRATTVFTDENIRSSAGAEFNDRQTRAILDQNLNQANEIQTRIESMKARNIPVPAELVKAQQEALGEIARLTQRPASVQNNENANTVAVNTNPGAGFDQAVANLPDDPQEVARIGMEVQNYLQTTGGFEVVANPNVPREQKLQAVQQAVQQLESDRFLTPQQKARIRQGLSFMVQNL